jgi:hypothetical protein
VPVRSAVTATTHTGGKIGTMTVHADLTFDPNEVGPDRVVEAWITQGPRATDASFDPQPGDHVTLVDDDSETQQGRVTRRDGNRVWVQLDQPGTPPSNERTIPTSLGMICTCDPERLAKADAALDAVIARLASGSSSFRPHTVTRESFLDEVCHSLHSMGASVGAIHVDQWAAVIVEGIDPEGWDAEVVAACDRVPDGLAATWSWVAAGGFHGGTPPPGAPAI